MQYTTHISRVLKHEYEPTVKRYTLLSPPRMAHFYYTYTHTQTKCSLATDNTTKKFIVIDYRLFGFSLFFSSFRRPSLSPKKKERDDSIECCSFLFLLARKPITERRACCYFIHLHSFFFFFFFTRNCFTILLFVSQRVWLLIIDALFI